MSLVEFAAAYNELSANEQTQFGDAVRRLLADGLVWREQEEDRRIYNFLIRRRELVGDYLAVAGWQLQFDERLNIFHVTHVDGAHRRRLNRETTIWLLLLRLLYAEQREHLTLTRYPVVMVSDVMQRYADFFPGQVIRKKSSLEESLRTLANLKLVRAAGGGTLHAGDPEQQIELLSTLEIVVPAQEITAVAERLGEYQRAGSEDKEATGEEEKV